MKQTLEVEGLPEGWNAVAYRVPVNGENFFYDGKICNDKYQRHEYLIVEKIQPRRIVLEATDEVRKVNRFDWAEIDGVVSSWNIPFTSACEYKIWREVKEPDIPLTTDEPKLSLSVIELKDISSNAKYIMDKIAEFIKDK